MNKISKILTEDVSLGAARAMLYAIKFSKNDFKKAQIGIGSIAFDGNPCNAHLYKLAGIAKKSVNDHESQSMKGLRYTTIGVSDGITMGTSGMRYSLPSREIIADSIEVMTKAHYYDGNITVASCDKNLPGSLMALGRINRPSLLIYGGSIKPGIYKDEKVDVVSAFQSYGQLLNNEISEDDREELLSCCCPGSGTCGGMYTANTMACATEAMGMLLPYSSSNPADSIEKRDECANVSYYMYNLLKKDIRPSDIITEKSIKNGIIAAIALGGSTNLVLHFLAVARTLNIKLDLEDFNEIGRNVPVFGNLKPFGKYLMHDIYEMGGTPIILKWLLENNYLDGDCMTVTGKTLEENLKFVKGKINPDIFCYDKPIKETSHIRVLHGLLAPDGCVAKITGENDKFHGIAKVYDREDDFLNDLENNIIKKNENTVIVIRYQGPKGGPGMPEMLKATSAIVGYGLKDTVAFITDGRFSGGSHGFIVGHISPEAYDGGPISLVKDGDYITINAKINKIELHVNDTEMAIRRDAWKLPEYVENNIMKSDRYLTRYRQLVGPSDKGCIY